MKQANLTRLSTTVRAFIFIAGRLEPFSSLVDAHLICLINPFTTVQNHSTLIPSIMFQKNMGSALIGLTDWPG